MIAIKQVKQQLTTIVIFSIFSDVMCAFCIFLSFCNITFLLKMESFAGVYSKFVRLRNVGGVPSISMTHFYVACFLAVMLLVSIVSLVIYIKSIPQQSKKGFHFCFLTLIDLIASYLLYSICCTTMVVLYMGVPTLACIGLSISTTIKVLRLNIDVLPD